MKKVTPFLMFQDYDAEAAMNFYTSIIEDSTIHSITRYGADGPGKEGTIQQAVFSLKGQDFICIDSHIKHDFNFTPSFSIYLTCDSQAEIVHLYQTLLESGKALMPLADYGFSKNFAWLVDQFGVAWQLNVATEREG